MTTPTSATARGVLWTRWRIETEEQFRERVLTDAARLGVVPIFEGQPRAKPEHGTEELPAYGRFDAR